MLSVCSVCFSKLGSVATGSRAGSGTGELFFETTAVEFTISGHSFIPRGDGTKFGTCASWCLKLLTTRFFAFGFAAVQQSCERVA
jgi:hypothetical protein